MVVAVDDKIVIELEDGKYVYTFENGMQIITRHGETWRNETGDGFILAMAQHIQDLEMELDVVKHLYKVE